MEEDLGDEWVVVPRERGESSKGKADRDEGKDPTTNFEGKDPRTREEKRVKTWEELVAQDEMNFVADEAVWEGHRWRKYV